MKPLLAWCSFLISAAAASSCAKPAANVTAPRSTAPSLASAPYEVHEWGLMRINIYEDTWNVGTRPPAERPPVIVVDKPVLYFHLDGVSTLTLTRVEVDALSGRIREHWPFQPNLDAARSSNVAWQNVQLTSGPCAASALPTDARRVPSSCDDLPPNELCETPSLASVRTHDAACVRTENGTERFLFYRSTNERFAPPLNFLRTPQGVQLTHLGDHALPAPIFLLRAQGARTMVSVVAAPAPHQMTRAEFPGVYMDDPRRPLREALLAQGLTASEADAFVASWSATLFGSTSSDAEGTVDERTGGHAPFDGTLPLNGGDTLLYFLPVEDIEEVSTLSFSPPPSIVRRVMAVWVSIPPSLPPQASSPPTIQS